MKLHKYLIVMFSCISIVIVNGNAIANEKAKKEFRIQDEIIAEAELTNVHEENEANISANNRIDRKNNILFFNNGIFSTTNPVNRKELINKVIEDINSGNKLVTENVKLQVQNPGVIEGVVEVMAMSPKNVIVYIEQLNDNNFKPIDKQYVSQTNEDVTTKDIDAKAEFPMMVHVIKRFKPHILPVLKGSIVDMPNIDTIRHNAFSPEPLPGTNKKINLGVYDVGRIKTVKMENYGELPLLCNIHKEMSSYIVTFNNPYFCLTDGKGKFRIENVPHGKYVLKTWHKMFKPVSVSVTVEPGQHVQSDLPIIKIKR